MLTEKMNIISSLNCAMTKNYYLEDEICFEIF